jgi:hypothetical protein
MRKTAVEWLKKELEAFGSPSELILHWSTFDELIDQAQAIEKEHIKKAYIMGWITRENKPIKTEASNSAYADNYLKDMFSDL